MYCGAPTSLLRVLSKPLQWAPSAFPPGCQPEEQPLAALCLPSLGEPDGEKTHIETTCKMGSSQSHTLCSFCWEFRQPTSAAVPLCASLQHLPVLLTEKNHEAAANFISKPVKQFINLRFSWLATTGKQAGSALNSQSRPRVICLKA